MEHVTIQVVDTVKGFAVRVFNIHSNGRQSLESYEVHEDEDLAIRNARIKAINYRSQDYKVEGAY